LGYLYATGKGVVLDYAEAYKWYQLAAAQGHQRARRAMKALAQVMTPRQLQESQARISSFLQQVKPIQGKQGISETP
jgi:hypothetical protein